MEEARSVKFAFQAVFHQKVYLGKLTFFLLQQKRQSSFFQQIKELLEQFFNCKLYLTNSIKLVEKNKFPATPVKIFLVTCISGNKNIFIFGLIISLACFHIVSYCAQRVSSCTSIGMHLKHCNIFSTLSSINDSTLEKQ